MTRAELERALINADAAGDVDAARALAAALRSPQIKYDPVDPTADMSGTQKFLAGAGKGFVDLGRGVKQLVGAMSREEMDDIKAQDAPLMDTGAGLVGNVTGTVASAIPAAFIPGANTVLGAGAIGGILGAAQPVGTDDSRLANATLGAATSAAVPLGVAGYRTGKSIVEPFTKKGQQAIAGRTLNRFATDPAAAQAAMRNPQVNVPGALPTAAEASMDPGIAVLQRSAQSLDPKIAGEFATREAKNTAARLGALQDIAGDAGKMDFYKGMREQAAKDLYEEAFKQTPGNTPWLKGQINSLKQRPIFNQALKEAQTLAANEGVKINPRTGLYDPKEAVRILHYTKLAMDDQIANTQGQTKKAYLATQEKLLAMMENENFAPAYREARATYAEMSKPINQMQVGQELLDKLRPSLMEGSETVTRTTPNNFARALQDAGQTVKNATGRKMSLEGVMTPEQMGTIEGIKRDVTRKAVAGDIGAVRGSPTAQYLSSQNLMRQIAGPLGIPESFMEGTLLQSLARPVDFAMKKADPAVQEMLAKGLLNPQTAAQFMALTPKEQAVISSLLARSGPVASGGLLGYSSEK